MEREGRKEGRKGWEERMEREGREERRKNKKERNKD